MRLPYVRVDGAVLRDRRQRHDQVAEPVVRLQPAAGADAHQPLDAELDELLDDDRRRRAAHPRRLHRDRAALPHARVSEHAALGVPLDDVVEVGLGDVLRAQRIAGKEARLRVVAGLGADVDRQRYASWDDVEEPFAHACRRLLGQL